MKRWLAVSIAAAVQVACASSTGATPPLRGTTWMLQGAPAGQTPFLVLDAQQPRLSGQGQCNRLMGGFTLDGDKLAFGQVASTRRACIPDDGIEQRLLDTLSQVKRWRVEAGELLLFGDAATPLLRFKPGKAP